MLILISRIIMYSIGKILMRKNYADYEEAKRRIQRVVRSSIEELVAGKVPLKDLEYVVRIHEDPAEKIGEKTLRQPYQCAAQHIGSGKPVSKGDMVGFVKVTPFSYRL